MKSLFILSIFLVGLFLYQTSHGQDIGNTSQSSEEEVQDLADDLPPLEELISLAVENSPLLMYNDNVIDQSNKEIKLEKRSWHDALSITGNYNQGDQVLLIGSSQGSSSGGGNNLLNGYRVGVNLILPLSTFTTRKTRIQIAELQVDAARNQKAEMEKTLTNQVILEYYELIASYKVMQIKSRARESAVLQSRMAETNFSEGTISLEDYSNVDLNGANAEVDFELAKSEYLAKYRQFEQLIGVSLKDLKR